MSIKIENTSQSLSSFGGILHFNSLLELSKLDQTLSDCLPIQRRVRKATSWQKFQALLTGFVLGAECLEDIDSLQNDSGFAVALNESVLSSQKYGDFLREFDFDDLRKLNLKLCTYSRLLRQAARPKKKDYIVDLDSTPHLQTGLKMEGVTYNYSKKRGLDSLQAYDQFGFPLYFDLRPGNTHTSVNAELAVHHCFHGLDRKYKRYFRADSGYANKNVFNACHAANASFVIASKSNVVHANVDRITNWKPTKKVNFYDGRKTEIGSVYYKKADHNEVLRIVVIRAEVEGPSLYTEYQYYGFITNMGIHRKSDEKIVQFYRARGNAENHIKEMKGNFDLRHFPCQKLSANKAYGLIGMFAMALTKFLGLAIHPSKNFNAKRIRILLFFKPVQVVKHARKVVFRFPEHHYWEACLWREKIHTLMTS